MVPSGGLKHDPLTMHSSQAMGSRLLGAVLCWWICLTLWTCSCLGQLIIQQLDLAVFFTSLLLLYLIMGFPGGSGRSPGGGHGNPLQYSWLENPKDRGAWWATVHRVTKSQTQLKRHSTHAQYKWSLSCTGRLGYRHRFSWLRAGIVIPVQNLRWDCLLWGSEPGLKPLPKSRNL